MTDNQEAVLAAATSAITELASKYRVDLLALMHPGGDRELGIKECAKIIAKHFSGFQPIMKFDLSNIKPGDPLATSSGTIKMRKSENVEMCCGTPTRNGKCSVCGSTL